MGLFGTSKDKIKNRLKPIKVLSTIDEAAFQLNFSAKNLKDTDVIGKSDPYFLLILDGIPVYQSEVIKENLNPKFRRVIFDRDDFKHVKEVKVEIWDKDLKFDDIIGVATLEYPFLAKRSYPVIDEKGRNAGEFCVDKVVVPEPIAACWIDQFDGERNSCYFKLYTDDQEKEHLYTSHVIKGQAYPQFEGNVADLSPAGQSLFVELCHKNEVYASGSIPYPFVNGRYPLKGKDDCYYVVGPAEREFSFYASANGLKNMDFIGKSDPMFTVKYKGETVFRSEESDDYAAPIWETVFFKNICSRRSYRS